MIDKLQNYFAFICSKINIKVVFFIMILIGTVFYVPIQEVDFMPSFYELLYRYLKYVFLFIIFLLAVPIFIKKKFDIPINKIVVIFSLYVGVCLLSIVLNPNKALFDGLEEFNFLFYSFIVSLFMLYILKKDEHKILIYAMTALIFYNCVLSYLSYIFDFGSVRGFFDNKVYYSRLLAIICTYLIILLFNTKEKSKKMILVTGILFLFINIAIQQQRGTYLIFLLAIAVILLATKNKKIILGGILSCCIIGLLFGYMIMKRVERDKMKIVNMSDAGRVSSTLAGVNMWKANPVFGVGHGTSRFKIREYENIRIFGFNNQMFAVHNVYVMQLAETGIVGFLLVNIARIMLLLALIRRFKGKKNIVKECPYELFYAISICIYLVSGMFQPINFREGYHLYLAVGAIILLRDSENNTNLEQQKLYLPQNKEF